MTLELPKDKELGLSRETPSGNRKRLLNHKLRDGFISEEEFNLLQEYLDIPNYPEDDGIEEKDWLDESLVLVTQKRARDILANLIRGRKCDRNTAGEVIRMIDNNHPNQIERKNLDEWVFDMVGIIQEDESRDMEGVLKTPDLKGSIIKAVTKGVVTAESAADLIELAKRKPPRPGQSNWDWIRRNLPDLPGQRSGGQPSNLEESEEINEESGGEELETIEDYLNWVLAEELLSPQDIAKLMELAEKDPPAKGEDYSDWINKQIVRLDDEAPTVQKPKIDVTNEELEAKLAKKEVIKTAKAHLEKGRSLSRNPRQPELDWLSQQADKAGLKFPLPANGKEKNPQPSNGSIAGRGIIEKMPNEQPPTQPPKPLGPEDKAPLNELLARRGALARGSVKEPKKDKSSPEEIESQFAYAESFEQLFEIIEKEDGIRDLDKGIIERTSSWLSDSKNLPEPAELKLELDKQRLYFERIENRALRAKAQALIDEIIRNLQVVEDEKSAPAFSDIAENSSAAKDELSPERLHFIDTINSRRKFKGVISFLESLLDDTPKEQRLYLENDIKIVREIEQAANDDQVSSQAFTELLGGKISLIADKVVAQKVNELGQRVISGKKEDESKGIEGENYDWLSSVRNLSDLVHQISTRYSNKDGTFNDPEISRTWVILGEYDWLPDENFDLLTDIPIPQIREKVLELVAEKNETSKPEEGAGVEAEPAILAEKIQAAKNFQELMVIVGGEEKQIDQWEKGTIEFFCSVVNEDLSLKPKQEKAFASLERDLSRFRNQVLGSKVSELYKMVKGGKIEKKDSEAEKACVVELRELSLEVGRLYDKKLMLDLGKERWDALVAEKNLKYSEAVNEWQAKLGEEKVRRIQTDLAEYIADLKKKGDLPTASPREVFLGGGQSVIEVEKEKRTEMVKATSSFDELFEVIRSFGQVEGSRQTYEAEDLVNLIRSVIANGNRSNDLITNTYGIRSKVSELFNKGESEIEQPLLKMQAEKARPPESGISDEKGDAPLEEAAESESAVELSGGGLSETDEETPDKAEKIAQQKSAIANLVSQRENLKQYDLTQGQEIEVPVSVDGRTEMMAIEEAGMFLDGKIEDAKRELDNLEGRSSLNREIDELQHLNRDRYKEVNIAEHNKKLGEKIKESAWASFRKEMPRGLAKVGFYRERLKGLVTFGLYDIRQAEKVRRSANSVAQIVSEHLSLLNIYNQPEDSLTAAEKMEVAKVREKVAVEAKKAMYLMGKLDSSEEAEVLDRALTWAKFEHQNNVEDQMIEKSVREFDSWLVNNKLQKLQKIPMLKNFGLAKTSIGDVIWTDQKKLELITQLKAEAAKTRINRDLTEFKDLATLMKKNLDPNYWTRYVYGGIEAALASSAVVYIAPMVKMGILNKLGAKAGVEAAKEAKTALVDNLTPKAQTLVEKVTGAPRLFFGEVAKGISVEGTPDQIEMKKTVWNTMKGWLENNGVHNPSNAQILEATKAVCSDNQIGIKEFGSTGKVLDVKMQNGFPLSVKGLAGKLAVKAAFKGVTWGAKQIYHSGILV